MRLTELEPRFIKIVEVGRLRRYVDTLAEAQGLMYLCPKCFAENGGPVGTHSILSWFLNCGVPDEEVPGPGRWEALGTGYDDLTFRAGSSSILLLGGCNAHFFIESGSVRMC